MIRFVSSLVTLVLIPGEVLAAESPKPVDYLKDVKPILAKNCFNCHSAKVQKNELRVDTAAALLKGGDAGPAIVPGKSKDSLLLKAVTGADGLSRMPLKKEPLSKEQIDLLAAWIDQGAKAPANEKPEDGVAGLTHWAFQAPERAKLPAAKNQQWVRNPIDRFILARLEKEGIAPSPEADRVTLIRRLSFDLLGLPPSLAEIDAFVKDDRTDAYERLVDRLLESPHYGERWGRHWLDVARYADSNGYSIDAPREIWKYRDWVIDAFNRDMPFDQFVIEQVAGDMLPNATLDQRIATGFHRNTPINQEGGIDKEQFRVESVADRVATTGVAFLGLTLGCARCHDHKYDPVSQKEFYQLFAFLNNADEPTLDIASPEVAKKREEFRQQIKEVETQIEEFEKEWRGKLTEEQRQKLKPEISEILRLGMDQRTEKQKQTLFKFLAGEDARVKDWSAKLADLKKREPKFPTTMVMQERKQPRETHIHITGDFTRKGERVSSGVPGVLHHLAKPGSQGAGLGGYNRLHLAKWLVDPKNPLVARVTINRMWQQYFGKGIVETENDFGTQSSPPSHPELLDWLAVEFMQPSVDASSEDAKKAWDLKRMHRLMVTSATYRQSSKHRRDLTEKDPHNRLLARQARLRLDAEIIRDAALTASGLLNRKIGGTSVYPPQPEGIYRFTQVVREWPTSSGADRYRRGMYVAFWRSAPFPGLLVFDAPDATASCTRRIRSNTPLQALTLLNDQAFLELAQGLATRILKEGPANDTERLEFAFRVCLSRKPTAKEAERLEKFLALQMSGFEAAPADAKKLAPAKLPEGATAPQFATWVAVSRVLLNLDEFITRE